MHYGELFTLLLSRKMSVKILRLIIDSYVRQSTRISWDNVYNNNFQLQGGVLSANLFTLYIDGLFTELKQSGYGCYINNTYIDALSYADDIILYFPSIQGCLSDNMSFVFGGYFTKTYIPYYCYTYTYVMYLQLQHFTYGVHKMPYNMFYDDKYALF